MTDNQSNKHNSHENSDREDFGYRPPPPPKENGEALRGYRPPPPPIPKGEPDLPPEKNEKE